MRPLAVRRLSVVLVALGLLMTGLAGAYSYWESYYQHRGFATVALVAGARKGRLVTVDFYSVALGRRADYLAYLPPGYDPARHRYPVYYLLHGSPSRPEAFIGIADMGIRLDNLVAEHRMRPMILVFPDGRIGGSTFSDSEWANTPSGNYESYVLDVVGDVDRRFATIPDRQDRVIAGFSAGAYGAINIALHNLWVFGSLQSWSGYYRETRSGVFAHATPTLLAYNSPLDYVREIGPQLAADPLRAFLFAGRDDESSPDLAPMADALAARGASVSYALYRGGHDWQLWHRRLNQMLILASRDVSRRPRLGSGIARTLTPGVVPTPKYRRPRLLAAIGDLVRRWRRPTGAAPAPLIGVTGVAPRRRGAHRHHRGDRHRHRHRRRHHRRHRHRRRAARRGGALPRRRQGRAPPALRIKATGLGLVRASGRGGGSGRGGLGLGELVGGLLLALGSAALINLGFLLQHRGLAERPAAGLAAGGPAAERPADGLAATLRTAVRNPTWLSGQLLGWIGFGTQIVAVAITPLSLVQAFAAGGLALSVPLAAVLFSYRITGRQLLAVILIAACLATLPIGFSTARDHLHAGSLGLTVAVLVALAIIAARAAHLRAVAAGAFYGVADAAIKAVSIGWHAHGGSALLSVWTLVAALATVGGFLTFQSALRDDGAIGSISVMTALAALVALACGLVAFGESLGASLVTVVAHLVAIAAVLGCVPVLAAAQAEMAEVAEHPDGGGAPDPGSWHPEYGSPG